MNKKQYNNVIEWTMRHYSGNESDSSLEKIKSVCTNMGISLPCGTIQEVYNIMSTDEYMDWRSCTMEEAREYADSGIAVVGINENRIVLIAAEDKEEPMPKMDSVITINEDTTAYAVSGLQFYASSKGKGWSETCNNPNNCSHVNKFFNSNNKTNLKNRFINLLGTKKSVGYTYTTSECIDLILQYDRNITNYCNQFKVPKEFVQTLLLRELWCHNPADVIADEAVQAYFGWQAECEAWSNLSTVEQLIIPYPTAPMGMRKDSSTGIGQMFAWVAINANNLAIEKGLISSRKYNANNWHDCRDIWNSLHNDPVFAIKMTTLEMYHCADYVGISGSMFHCSIAQIKGILSRYNGTGDAAIVYGNDCFEYYKIFKMYS